MQRAVLGVPFTLSVLLGDDGDPLPDAETTVTVTVTNSEGTTLLAATEATSAGAGQYTHVLPSALLRELDLLTASWVYIAGAAEQTASTLLEVVGRRMFTLAQMHDLLGDSDSHTGVQIEQARLRAEHFLEGRCHASFIPAFSIDTFVEADNALIDTEWGGEWGAIPGRYDRPHDLELHRPWLTALRSIVVDGTALTDTQLSQVTVYPDGVISRMCPWPGTTVVSYTHGRGIPDSGRVAMILARHRLINGPLDNRALGIPVEGGGVVPLLTPGVRGSMTGLPEVDEFISQWSMRVPGVA